jgi:hypothetical protein
MNPESKIQISGKFKTGAWCYYGEPCKMAQLMESYNWYAVMGITTEEDATPTQEQIGRKISASWLARSYDEEWTTLPILGGTASGGKMKETEKRITNSRGFLAFPE